MAVYTSLDFDEINAAIKRFGIGEVVSFEGISAGMENSNYFVTTSSHHLLEEQGEKRGEYVLTLFEELPESQLPFHIQILQTLQASHIAVAAPINDFDGLALQHIKGKPAVLCPRLSGEHPVHTSIKQCEVLGQTLAKIHQCLESFPDAEQHAGIRDTPWLKNSINKAKAFLSEDESRLADTVFNRYQDVIEQHRFSQSILHGDLFHDNSLFNGDELSGIIDFFNAGFGHCIYDLAIVVNDWCLNELGDIKIEHYQHLLKAYAAIRPFTDAEKRHWPDFLQAAALRFWISRLLSQKQSLNQQHELRDGKDPQQYKHILMQHRQRSSAELP